MTLLLLLDFNSYFISATAEAGAPHDACVAAVWVCIRACMCTSFTFSALLHPLANYTQGLFGGGGRVCGVEGHVNLSCL